MFRHREVFLGGVALGSTVPDTLPLFYTCSFDFAFHYTFGDFVVADWTGDVPKRSLQLPLTHRARFRTMAVFHSDDRGCRLLRHSDAYLPQYTRPHLRTMVNCTGASWHQEFVNIRCAGGMCSWPWLDHVTRFVLLASCTVKHWWRSSTSLAILWTNPCVPSVIS